jgi:DNA-binding NarL/FixJ family response regulator
MIKIVIVEDIVEIREGLRYLLNLDEGIKVLQTFDAAEKLLQRGDILSLTDVVLMDIELPGIDGIEATARIKRTYPAIDILILTIFEEREKIVRAINAGASGYILKNDNPAELVRQIKSVFSGGSPISPHAARKLLDQLQSSHGMRRSPADYQLTAREIEICSCMLKGLTYREMADQLFMAGSTAKRHILNIYKKLSVNSKVEFMKKVHDEHIFENF